MHQWGDWTVVLVQSSDAGPDGRTCTCDDGVAHWHWYRYFSSGGCAVTLLFHVPVPKLLCTEASMRRVTCH
jgi:hypothetical protein